MMKRAGRSKHYLAVTLDDEMMKAVCKIAEAEEISKADAAVKALAESPKIKKAIRRSKKGV